MKYVDGVNMASLTEDGKHVVKKELVEHMESLYSLRS